MVKLFNNPVKLYYKTLQLRRGIPIILNLTFSCPLRCKYCSMTLPAGRRPHCRVATLEDWKNFMLRLPPGKFREVKLCGGEVTWIPWMPELANWLLEQGYHVLLVTNLGNEIAVMRVRPHYRFKVWATYHSCDDPVRFLTSYERVKQVHEMEVQELYDREKPGKPMFKFSRTCVVRKADEIGSPEWQVAPDATRCYISCYDMYKDLSE
jgi:hypothetical protein